MIRASHYVIKNISIALERRDPVHSKTVLEKFSNRYAADKELQAICDDFKTYLKTRDKEELDKIKTTLQKLNEIRRKEISGSTKLWFKDRRYETTHLIKIT